MYFRNLQVFRFINNGLTLEALETALAASPFVPCAENQAASTGWTSPRKNGLFVHAVNQQWLITLVCEQRSVPGAVVNKEVARRIEEIGVSVFGD